MIAHFRRILDDRMTRGDWFAVNVYAVLGAAVVYLLVLGGLAVGGR